MKKKKGKDKEKDKERLIALTALPQDSYVQENEDANKDRYIANGYLLGIYYEYDKDNKKAYLEYYSEGEKDGFETMSFQEMKNYKI